MSSANNDSTPHRPLRTDTTRSNSIGSDSDLPDGPLSDGPHAESPHRHSGVPDRWFILSLLAVNYFTLYLHRSSINYLQPPIKKDLELTETGLGLLHWGFYLSYAIAQIYVGYFGDRFRRRTVLTVSLFFSSAALAGMGLATDFWHLFVLRVLLAALQSASVPAIASVVADCFAPKRRSTAVSIYLLAIPMSIVAAGKFGGYLADHYSWRIALIVFAATGTAVWLMLLLILREPERTERSHGVGLGAEGASIWRTLASVLLTPSFLLLALAYIQVSTINQLAQFWLPRYVFNLFQMKSLEEAGTFSTVAMNVGTVFGLFAGGVFADVWSRRWIGGRFSVQTIGQVLCVPALAAMGLSDNRWTFVAAMLLYGFGVNLYLANLWTTTFDVVDPAARATAIGLLNVATGVLGVWVSPLIGYLYEKKYFVDLGPVFTCSSVSTAIAVGLLAIILLGTLSRDFKGARP